MSETTRKDTRKGNRHRPGYSTEYMRIWRARQKDKLITPPKPSIQTTTEERNEE